MIRILWKGEVLEMASNDKVSISDVSDVTRNKLEEGAYVGDNVVIQNKQYNFTGLVSNFKSFSYRRNSIANSLLPELVGQVGAQIQNRLGFSPIMKVTGDPKTDQKFVPEYFALLQKIRDSREVVTFQFDEQIAAGGVKDCIITKADYERRPDLGDAYMVDISLTQIRRTAAVSFSERKESAVPDISEDGTDGGLKPTQEDTTPPTNSIGAGIVGVIGDLFGGG